MHEDVHSTIFDQATFTSLMLNVSKPNEINYLGGETVQIQCERIICQYGQRIIPGLLRVTNYRVIFLPYLMPNKDANQQKVIYHSILSICNL